MLYTGVDGWQSNKKNHWALASPAAGADQYNHLEAILPHEDPWYYLHRSFRWHLKAFPKWVFFITYIKLNTQVVIPHDEGERLMDLLQTQLENTVSLLF